MIINPVLGREIKERMRSRRAMLMVIAFLGLLAVILYLTYRGGIMMLSDRFSPMAGNTASLGRLMFEWLLFFLVMFVAFMAPGVAAGSIVGERERRTLHPLQVTLLSPRSIVLGKLGASIAFVTLLVLATAPLFAVPLVLGGVSPWEVMRGFIVILALELALASLATFMSAVAKRIQFAIVAAYGLAVLLLVGTVVLLGAEVLWQTQRHPRREPKPLAIYLNPVAAIADAVTDPAAPDFLPSPLSPLGNYLRDRQMMADEERRFGGMAEVDMVQGGGQAVIVEAGGDVIRHQVEAFPRPVPVPPVAFDDAQMEILDAGGGFEIANHNRRRELPAIRLWMIHVVFLLLISSLSLWLAARRLRSPVVKMMKVRHKT
ncbi:MAG TPA: ABC transporter permease subunit [Actinomycetota bacterium]|nr:ABC transporter permease subunit [Actinomycetota bacterium]